MSNVFRALGAIVAGMAVAFLLVVGVELFSAVVHPLPPDFGGTQEEMCKHVERYPDWVLAVVVPAWAVTAFVGTLDRWAFSHTLVFQTSRRDSNKKALGIAQGKFPKKPARRPFSTFTPLFLARWAIIAWVARAFLSAWLDGTIIDCPIPSSFASETLHFVGPTAA